MKSLIYLIVIFYILSCSPPDTESDICIDNMLDSKDMEHYSGVIVPQCQNYLLGFTHEENDYFMLENPCADLALHLLNCENVDVCADNSMECQTIMSNMTHQGVVGKGVE